MTVTISIPQSSCYNPEMAASGILMPPATTSSRIAARIAVTPSAVSQQSIWGHSPRGSKREIGPASTSLRPAGTCIRRCTEMLHQMRRSGLRPGLRCWPSGAQGAGTDSKGEANAICSFSASCSVRSGLLKYELMFGSIGPLGVMLTIKIAHHAHFALRPSNDGGSRTARRNDGESAIIGPEQSKRTGA